MKKEIIGKSVLVVEDDPKIRTLVKRITLLENIIRKKRIQYNRINLTVSAVRNPEAENRIEPTNLQSLCTVTKKMNQEHAEKLASLVVKIAV
jgi:uncharacterized OsmC-like protein